MVLVYICRLVLILAFIDGLRAERNSLNTFSCSDAEFGVIHDLHNAINDTFKAGTTLFYTLETLSFSKGCESRPILNLRNTTDNFTAVEITNDLGSYCDVLISCSFKCGDQAKKWLTIRAPIRRTQIYYQLSFTNGQIAANVSEAAEVGFFVNLKKSLTVVVENCTLGNNFSAYTRRFYINKDASSSLPFKWGAETNGNSLHVNSSLDYEKMTSYNITVKAELATNTNEMLHGTATTTIVVNVIDVDDNNPRFNISQTDSYTLEILENNTSIVNQSLKTNPPIYAFDPDLGIQSPISYRILDNADNGSFDIENDGSIKVKRVLDYERKNEYRLLIEAAQQDKPETATAIATLLVHVLDMDEHLPIFTEDIYKCSTSEHSTVGSVICLVTAIDEDPTPENSNFTYTSWNESLAVSVNKDGKIMVNDSAALDRETTGGKITVQVGTLTSKDKYGGNATVVITLTDINDNNPLFEKNPYQFSITNASVGVLVGQVNATDKDDGLNAIITYSVLPVFGSSTCMGNLPSNTKMFSVNSSTGEITVSDHTASLCRKYVLTVNACDKGANSRCSFTTVEISLPETTEHKNITQKVSVLEELPVNSSVAFVECSAADHGYEYHGGPEFEVDIRNGMLITRKVLDRETNDTYNFKVDVKIANILLCSVNISLTVKDVNDHSPVFNATHYEFSLPTSPGLLVGTVKATDEDLAENGNVSYFLKDQRNSPFSMDQMSGQLTIKDSDQEIADIMQVFVKAVDNGIPARESSVIVYIIGQTSDNMVLISTPLTVEQINNMKTDLEKMISTILDLDIEIGDVDEVKNKSSPHKSKIHISTPQNSTISKHMFLSQILAHYEDIRSLFYQASPNTGEEKPPAALGASEIGLIVMAGVILAGTILAIFIVHRQFNSQKRYKQLYDSLTKNSSIYESQEITLNIPDDGPTTFNGDVQDQDLDSDDSQSSPVTSAVNPAYHSDTDLTTLDETMQGEENDSNNQENDTTEVKTALQQLTDSYEQEDNETNKDNKGEDESVAPIVYAHVDREDDSGTRDYVNTNVVHAKIEPEPVHEDGEAFPSASRNKDLISFESDSSSNETNEQSNGDNDLNSPDDDIGDEPVPDYNQKQVRFHSEVLDAGENKIQPLKVKNEGLEGTDSPEESPETDGDTAGNDITDAAKDSELNGDTTKVEENEDEEDQHVVIEDDTDRLEEEINSPNMPYIENIQDEFFFGELESTHF